MKNKYSNIQMKSQKFNTLLINKKSFTVSFLVMLFLIVLLPMTTSAQQCSLTLTAKNNIESVNSEGRVYFMVVQNNTSEGIDVNFTTANNNTGNNPDASDGSNNVNLNAVVLDYNGMAHSGNFHLNANDVLEFQVKVTVPAGTPENHWNGTLLTASSDKCFDYSTSIKLFTFIPIPE